MRIFALLFILFFLFLFSGSCSRVPNNEKVYSRDTAYKLIDLRYGPDTLNFLDLYLPAKRNAKTPVMITIHGGGWVIGDKSHWKSEYAVAFFEQEMIVANINHRLIKPGVLFKDIMADMEMVMRFLKENRATYGIDAAKFNLVGYSAGSHIALVYAYSEDKENDVASVISHWGPTSLNDVKFRRVMDSAWKSPERIQGLLGEDYSINSNSSIRYSPILNLSKKIPTLMIHGSKDEVVPLEQALMLRDSLNKRSIRNFLLIMPDLGHQSPTGIYIDSVKRTIQKWVKIE